MVWSAGIDDSHVDPAQDRQLKREDDLRAGHEIGGGDPNAALGQMNGVREEQAAGLELVGWTGRQHQNGLCFRSILLDRPVQLEDFAGGPMPVVNEGELDRLDRRPADGGEGIAPRPKARASAQILVSDVQPTDIGLLTIDHDDFPMIAKVDLKTGGQAPAGEEWRGLDARRAQLADVTSGQRTRADRIVEKIDAHPGSRLGEQLLLQLTS